MFFIPLNQIESVQLVINALRMAGGESDCGSCPAHRACTRQCLTVADAIHKMVESGALPGLNPPESDPPSSGPGEKGKEGAKGRLTVIK